MTLAAINALHGIWARRDSEGRVIITDGHTRRSFRDQRRKPAVEQWRKSRQPKVVH